MRSILTIFLIFTHYVWGAPCIVEKDTSVTTATNEIFSSVYSDTKPTAISTIAQSINKTTRITYSKRFTKRHRKTKRLLSTCLQSNFTNAFFYTHKATQNIPENPYALNSWLSAYLSLFAFFRI